MNKELKTKQIEMVSKDQIWKIVIEYRGKSNAEQMKKPEGRKDVTVYAYKRGMERIRRKKDGGTDHWIV